MSGGERIVVGFCVGLLGWVFFFGVILDKVFEKLFLRLNEMNYKSLFSFWEGGGLEIFFCVRLL